MTYLSIDFETRSTVDLSERGAYVYAADPTTDIWCMAWAFEGEDPQLWIPILSLPPRVLAHIAAGGEIRAWNAAFERVIWNHIMVPRYAAPNVALEQWTCTMAEACAMALPAALGQASAVLGVAQQKDSAGADLMKRMARPRKIEADGALVWWDEPDRLQRLYDYCKQDVRTEMAIIPCLRRLSPLEKRVYHLDQRMNDRGVKLDVPLVKSLQAIALRGAEEAAAELTTITSGAVSAVTQNGRLLAWVREQGLDTDTLAKAAVTELLAGTLPEAVRRVLTIRQEAGKSSIAKLEKMLGCAGADDRIRGLLFYHGATTGRWAGRLVQPQNFPRGDVPDAERFLDMARRGDYAALELFYPPLHIASSLLRACLTVEDGHRMLAADYSAIEARVVNWLAGQEDILDLFRRGVDVYVHNASRLYGIPMEEVQKFPHRQTGKFQELACGFGMGAKKAVSAAKDVYGLDLVAMHGSETAAFAKAKEIVDGYRTTHNAVVGFWYETERACLDAVRYPGSVVTFGAQARLKAVKAGGYLYIVLPSGRPLCYPAPRIVEAETPWSRTAREDAMAENAVRAELGLDPITVPPIETKPSLEFSSQDSYTKQWGRERTYGGKLVENITQAVARDLMAEAMLRAEDAGFEPICTIHDEIVAEVPDTTGFGPSADETVAEFEQVLSTLPTWAAGCPVAAEGWMGPRYRK